MKRALRVTFVLCFATAVGAGCQDRTRTRRVLEPYVVVPGTPTVDTKTPEVQVDGTQETGSFGINVPRQCDVFRQLPARQVDILWVVDSSGSMAPKQARLAANIQGFINQLVNANPPIDFHIAVVSTDTDDPMARGKLRPWSISGFTEDFIACAPTAQGVVTCNTGPDVMTAVQAFGQMSQVGISGSPQERGLYAAYLALTNPFNNSTEAVTRFVRPEASLYVVVVSDEDDSSCAPLTRQPVCTADPGCRCAPDNVLIGAGAWGSTEYFTRFFETFKGFGNQDSVALAAIVATTEDAGVPSQFGDPNPHVGCCRSLSSAPCPSGGVNDGGYEVAYFGDRYVKVAAATGGVAVSICQEDFSGSLAALGYAASGLRQEFRLTRGPDLKVDGGVAEGLSVYVSKPTAASCMVDGNCPAGQVCRGQRCADRLPVSIAPQPTGAAYVRCDSAGLRNMVRFEGAAVPEPLSTVEVCYDVLATFQNSCP